MSKGPSILSLGAAIPAFSTFALYFSALSTTALILKALYNRYFHPLRKIPGPFWSSLSRVWWVWLAISGNQHETHVACHEKYGPIVRVAPHFIMLNDPEYVAQFYKWDRSDYTLPFETTPRQAGVTTQADMKAHARQRKKVASGFSLTAVLQNEDLIDSHISAWLAGLHKQASSGDIFDFAAWAQWLAMDVVMDVVFGAPLGFVSQEQDVGGLIQSIRDLFLAATILAHLPGVVRLMQTPFIWRWVAPQPTDSRGVGAIMGAGNNAIHKRLTEGNVDKRRDILQQWIEYRDKDGQAMTEEELDMEALGPIAAGSDTTSTAIRAVVLYVASSPRIHGKLMQELDSSSLSSPVKYQEAQNLPYLQAIILETLRIYQPVGQPLSRIVPAGGAEIKGYHIPQGTWILMPQWCLGHNKDIYGLDAEIFRPERWMHEPGETEDEAQKRLEKWKKIDTTFGNGQVTCLGRNIAMMEICKAIVGLFTNFDVQIVKPERPWKMTNNMVFLHDEFNVHLTPRGEV